MSGAVTCARETRGWSVKPNVPATEHSQQDGVFCTARTALVPPRVLVLALGARADDVAVREELAETGREELLRLALLQQAVLVQVPARVQNTI